MATIIDQQKVERAIRIGCDAALIKDVKAPACKYPGCDCKSTPTAIRAALAYIAPSSKAGQ